MSNELFELVYNFFDKRYYKTVVWFNAPNPLLGNVSPNDMIAMGREDKLLDFVKSQLEGNHP